MSNIPKFNPIDCNCQYAIYPQEKDGRIYSTHTEHAEDCPAHKRIMLLKQGEGNVSTKVKMNHPIPLENKEGKVIGRVENVRMTDTGTFIGDIVTPQGKAEAVLGPKHSSVDITKLWKETFNPAVEDAIEEEEAVSATNGLEIWMQKAKEQYAKKVAERVDKMVVEGLPLDHPEVKAMERLDTERFTTEKIPNVSEQIKKAMGVQKFETGAVRGTDANDKRFDLIPQIGLRRLAETCAFGAKRYGVDNWRKGFPVSDLMSHALTHLHLWLMGDTTEDHLAHASWNLFVIQEFEETRPELIDVASRKKE